MLGALSLQVSYVGVNFLDIVVAFLSGLLGLADLVQDNLMLLLDVLLYILYLTELALNFFGELFRLALRMGQYNIFLKVDKLFKNNFFSTELGIEEILHALLEWQLSFITIYPGSFILQILI